MLKSVPCTVVLCLFCIRVYTPHTRVYKNPQATLNFMYMYVYIYMYTWHLFSASSVTTSWFRSNLVEERDVINSLVLVAK